MKNLKGLLLLSGGIDSPVAGHLIRKKGVDVIGLHFDNRPFTEGKALELAKRLAIKIGINKLYIVNYGELKSDIVKNCKRRYTCVLCRRLMFRIAGKIAEKENCDFLITGENLGQVASQTLSNMISEHSSISIPVLRPLLCNDKQEIIEVARQIDTYDISIEPSICCTLVPKSPATSSTVRAIENEENNLNFEELLKNAVETVQIELFDR
ncbi:MAG: hypothetical protein U9R08_04340 [Nanoarchaeota archaeon]|nr:hypothetical protein [Nanoarchaeota archaeon]